MPFFLKDAIFKHFVDSGTQNSFYEIALSLISMGLNDDEKTLLQ